MSIWGKGFVTQRGEIRDSTAANPFYGKLSHGAQRPAASAVARTHLLRLQKRGVGCAGRGETDPVLTVWEPWGLLLAL